MHPHTAAGERRLIRTSGASRSSVAPLFLAAVCAVLLGLLPSAVRAALAVNSARIWPAEDYTRITLESGAPVRHTLFALSDPERLVLDLEDVDLSPALLALPDKVGASDPYIRAIRVGRFKPGVVRIVLDLKKQVTPQIFSLKPVADYGYRLVLDVYPVAPPDPLMALALKAEDKLNSGELPPSNSGDAGKSLPPAQNPTATKAEPSGAPSRASVKRLITIAIDAGHGGEDPGAKGRNGTYEKNVTLAIARKLKALVDGEPNMRGVLIRDGDYFIPLATRVAKARRVHADLFVSIHADAYIKPDAQGSSVFALSERGATSAAARWLAKSENNADLIGGVNLDVPDPYLKQTLLDLSQTATINDSLKLGKAVLSQLGEVNRLHKPWVEQAGFAVLKAPDIPSILVETAFISNPREEEKLKNDAYQEKIADAILAGIKRYFAKNPPLARSKLAQNAP